MLRECFEWRATVEIAELNVDAAFMESRLV